MLFASAWDAVSGLNPKVRFEASASRTPSGRFVAADGLRATSDRTGIAAGIGDSIIDATSYAYQAPIL